MAGKIFRYDFVTEKYSMWKGFLGGVRTLSIVPNYTLAKQVVK